MTNPLNKSIQIIPFCISVVVARRRIIRNDKYEDIPIMSGIEITYDKRVRPGLICLAIVAVLAITSQYLNNTTIGLTLFISAHLMLIPSAYLIIKFVWAKQKELGER